MTITAGCAGGSGYYLAATGTPGSTMTFDVGPGVPGGLGALCYAYGRGSHQVFNPLTGNLITTGLSSAGFKRAHFFMAAGSGWYSHSVFVPAAAAGIVSVQAIEGTLELGSNVVDL